MTKLFTQPNIYSKPEYFKIRNISEYYIKPVSRKTKFLIEFKHDKIKKY